MSVRPDAAHQAGLWVEKAEHDLANAEHTLTRADDCPADTAAFHAQQCAEKYLKSLLVIHGHDVPRTHDLVVTLKLARQAADLDLSAERCAHAQSVCNGSTLPRRLGGDHTRGGARGCAARSQNPRRGTGAAATSGARQATSMTRRSATCARGWCCPHPPRQHSPPQSSQDARSSHRGPAYAVGGAPTRRARARQAPRAPCLPPALAAGSVGGG